MKRVLILSFLFFNSIVFSQVKFNDSLFSTHNLNNKFIENSLNLFLEDESFKNIKKKLVVSLLTRNDEIIIRIVPLFKDFYDYEELTSDYIAYFDYKGFKILYYGNDSYLKKNKNIVLENLFIKSDKIETSIDESENRIINLYFPEYYGMEFIYIKGELKWKEKNYFGSMIVNQFLSLEFYKNVIYKTN